MRRLAPFAVVALALVGCSKPDPEKALPGKWTVSDITLSAALSKNPQANQIKTAMQNSSVEIRPDHKYTMKLMNIAIDGDWALKERTVSLTPKTIMGQPVETLKAQLKKIGQGAQADKLGKSTPYTLGADDKTLVGQSDGSTITMKKSDAK